MWAVVCLVASFLLMGCSANEKKDNSFDLMILTQHWPFTTCLDWEEGRQHGSCRKIDRPTWTVHGLWPTQLHKIAPNFCNNSWPFDVSTLASVRTDMDTYWPDVELRDVPNSLWEHEWTKHGTCASQGLVPGISSESEYFAAGCRLGKESPVTDWLAAAGVVPSDSKRYPMSAVWDAVVAGAGTRPHVDCQKIQGEVYIKEIKVCYDKSLTRVDCDGIKGTGGEEKAMMGTCLRWPEFLYPTSAVPHPSSLKESGSPSLGGLVSSLLAVATVALVATGALLYRRRVRSQRGYESL